MVALPAALRRPLPARALGRPGAARRDRARARGRAADPRARRADLGARRLGPGRGDEPADPPAGRARARPTSSSATTSAWCATSATRSWSCTSAGSSRRAPTTRCSTTPLHPYTRALAAAVPVPDPVARGGPPRREPPEPCAQLVAERRAGCPYSPRCPLAEDVCLRRSTRRSLELAPEHLAACHVAAREAGGTDRGGRSRSLRSGRAASRHQRARGRDHGYSGASDEARNRSGSRVSAQRYRGSRRSRRVDWS